MPQKAALAYFKTCIGMGAKVLLLLAVVAILMKLIAPRPESGEVVVSSVGDGNGLYRDLFSCQLTLQKSPESYKVELNAFNLLLPHQKQRVTNSTVLVKDSTGVSFEKLDLNNLNSSTLDASLPFIFFINGFNHNGAISGSWMEGAANVLAQHNSTTTSRANSSSSAVMTRQKYNVVFLSWRIKGIITSDTIDMVLAYYRTMANYDTIMDEIAVILTRLVDFIEATQGGGSWLAVGGEGYELARANYYGQFEFYAHSLGSHLMSNAIEGVQQSRPWVKFGKLVGLDPALPCFLDENYGLSADRLNNSVNQVLIVHSNAVFSGVYAERSNIDIVLNGGTFQPSCNWLDFTCSHVRSNDIFTYVDDQCQMVAYWCSKYEQFKYGACESCDYRPSNKTGSHQQQFSNCILVNMPEQHVDSGELLLIRDEDDVRQLDREENKTNSSSGTPEDDQMIKDLPKLTTKRHGFHFVNTNPNFVSSKTHCLQHYQLRLVVVAEADAEGQIKCPVSSYFLDGMKDIHLKLLYESGPRLNDAKSILSRSSGNMARTRGMGEVGGKKMAPIVQNRLYTGLVTFSGKPELFVGSMVDTIDLEKWSACLVKEKVKGDIQLTLDIAFMSHTRPSVRHAYSSILCGRWNPHDVVAVDEDKEHHHDKELILSLCKPSELSDVSGQIDEILKQITFHHQYDSWQVSLLDSLFYLYSKWEPLR